MFFSRIDAFHTVYCASKFGLRGFTESLLVELGDSNVRDSIAYLMDPEDVANILMANAITRTNLNVDQVVIKNRIVD